MFRFSSVRAKPVIFSLVGVSATSAYQSTPLGNVRVIGDIPWSIGDSSPNTRRALRITLPVDGGLSDELSKGGWIPTPTPTPLRGESSASFDGWLSCRGVRTGVELAVGGLASFSVWCSLESSYATEDVREIEIGILAPSRDSGIDCISALGSVPELLREDGRLGSNNGSDICRLNEGGLWR